MTQFSGDKAPERIMFKIRTNNKVPNRANPLTISSEIFPEGRSSVDMTPWNHPFLTANHIERFRDYSEKIWEIALTNQNQSPRQLNCAFAVNMAQNMYKWSRLGAKYGAKTTLYLHPHDKSAISRPEWEEFDGEFGDIFDGDAFLSQHGHLQTDALCVEPSLDGKNLSSTYFPIHVWEKFNRLKREIAKKLGRPPQLQGSALSDIPAVIRLFLKASRIRYVSLLELPSTYYYFRWAEMLARHDVTYIASLPYAAYVSGKPYCIFSVGGDMQFDCGRTDELGKAMRVAFSHARFILASNPHTLAHCRRLGLTNAVYLPYPMDSDRYCPGNGLARQEWIARFGGEVFVLMTSRIDRDVKGQGESFFDMLIDVARSRPEVRFIFLGWGNHAEEFRARVAASGVEKQLIMLSPVGKTRLIDYYRSCDIVLDQFVYGYFGATALEAASIGKPVIMKLRTEQYAPLYRGDVAPVVNAGTADEIRHALLGLIDSPQRRQEVGTQLREWLLRNHGEQKTVPLLLALLRLAADRVKLPVGMDNPLLDPLSEEERQYHESCLQRPPAS